MHYVGVSLVYRLHNLSVWDVKICIAFLKTFFNRCGGELEVAPSQAYFLQKRRGMGPLCHPMPSYAILDLYQHHHLLSKSNWQRRSWYCRDPFIPNHHLEDDGHIISLLWHQGEGPCVHSPWFQAQNRHQIHVEGCLFLILEYGNGYRWWVIMLTTTIHAWPTHMQQKRLWIQHSHMSWVFPL